MPRLSRKSSTPTNSVIAALSLVQVTAVINLVYLAGAMVASSARCRRAISPASGGNDVSFPVLGP